MQQKVQSAAVRDSAFATRDLNKAAVAAAKAQLRTAELNLSYTKVTAPISGITSQEQVNEGSLIGTGCLFRAFSLRSRSSTRSM